MSLLRIGAVVLTCTLALVCAVTAGKEAFYGHAECMSPDAREQPLAAYSVKPAADAVAVHMFSVAVADAWQAKHLPGSRGAETVSSDDFEENADDLEATGSCGAAAYVDILLTTSHANNVLVLSATQPVHWNVYSNTARVKGVVINGPCSAQSSVNGDLDDTAWLRTWTLPVGLTWTAADTTGLVDAISKQLSLTVASYHACYRTERIVLSDARYHHPVSMSGLAMLLTCVVVLAIIAIAITSNVRTQQRNLQEYLEPYEGDSEDGSLLSAT